MGRGLGGVFGYLGVWKEKWFKVRYVYIYVYRFVYIYIDYWYVEMYMVNGKWFG